MSGAFSAAVLSEKLIKLNASQQSIESLSHWCIHHRKRAKQIVKTWQKEFLSAPKEKRVSFLYLANDILQNSRKKGSEFVSEFWKVLNTALKDVKENGDETGRNAVSRLVNIWEERKVFGSRAQSLKETFLGDNPIPEFEPQEKHEKDKEKEKEKEKQSSMPFIKIALDGGILEKLVKAFKEVTENDAGEDATIEECSSVKTKVVALADAVASGDQGSSDELHQQESKLKNLIEQLEHREKARHQLVTYLHEILLEQETKLETLSSQIEGFRREQKEPAAAVQNMAPVDEGNKKQSTAAEFAAKLAASTSSAAILSSLLSSLTPEETASLGLHSDKRPRLETKSAEGVIYSDVAKQQHQQYMIPPPVPMPPPFLGGSSMGLVYPPPPPPPPPPPGIQVPMPPTGMQVPMPPTEVNPHHLASHHPQKLQQLNPHLLPPQQQMNPQHLTQQQMNMLNPLPPGCGPNTYSLPPYYPSTQL